MPACLESCEAVFGFLEVRHGGTPRIAGWLPDFEFRLKHVFLGPWNSVRTVDLHSRAICECFDESSAATAFVCGVATCVLSRRPELSADGLVLAMIDDSEPIEEWSEAACKFFRVRVPL